MQFKDLRLGRDERFRIVNTNGTLSEAVYLKIARNKARLWGQAGMSEKDRKKIFELEDKTQVVLTP